MKTLVYDGVVKFYFACRSLVGAVYSPVSRAVGEVGVLECAASVQAAIGEQGSGYDPVESHSRQIFIIEYAQILDGSIVVGFGVVERFAVEWIVGP